jgi:hypothetical protein
MNTALIFWVYCVAYPAFTILQSSVIIWFVWRFRDELSWKLSTAPVLRPRFWRARCLPTWSPNTTSGAEPPIYRQPDDRSSVVTEVPA